MERVGIKKPGMMHKTIILLMLILAGLCFDASSQTIPAWKIGDLETYMQKSTSPVIVAFWATYCIPCLKEIPYFEEAVDKYKKDGVKILLVSLDMKDQYSDDIKATIKKRKIAAPVVWLDETDADYFCPKVDSAWSGAMPATLFINNKKGYRKFFEEEISKQKLNKEIDAMIAGKR